MIRYFRSKGAAWSIAGKNNNRRPVAESFKTPACNAWRGAMNSPNPRLDLYDPKTLEALRQAFDGAWVMIQARDPFRDFEKDRELKTALSRKLLRLSADGVTDPIELREWALEDFPLR